MSLALKANAVKPVGKPDAGNPHAERAYRVRFDERGWETGRPFWVSARAHPRLYGNRLLNARGKRLNHKRSRDRLRFSAIALAQGSGFPCIDELRLIDGV